MKGILIFISLACCVHIFAQDRLDVLTFDLSLEQMSTIRLKSNQTNTKFHPSFDLSLDELASLDFHKVAVESSRIDINYDLTLEELSELTISSNEGRIIPKYDNSIQILSKLLVTKEYIIENQLHFPYDLPIELLMKLSIGN